MHEPHIIKYDLAIYVILQMNFMQCIKLFAYIKLYIQMYSKY